MKLGALMHVRKDGRMRGPGQQLIWMGARPGLHALLGWVLPEVGAEIRTLAQVVYLGGDPRRHRKGRVRKERQ